MKQHERRHISGKAATLSAVIVIVLLAFGNGLPKRAGAAETGRVALTHVAPGFAIVTEVNNARPWVGQQVSVIYRLRAAAPPTAVDVDPQQFAGFWSEIAPPAAGDRAEASMLGGRAASDFLLRQVIAFPLSDGPHVLPPLRLKIKTAGLSSGNPDDWDLICSSEPLALEVSAVPDGSGDSMPLVGSFEGSLTRAGGGGRELILEVQGTANLAFFDPAGWVPKPDGMILSAVELDWEKMVQTRALAEAREVILLQRRRWRIYMAGNWRRPVQVADMRVRVFQQGAWLEKRIPGLVLPPLQFADATVPDRPGAGKPAFGKPGIPAIRLSVSIAAIAALAAAWLLRRRSQRCRHWKSRGLAALERVSVRSHKAFFDTAHRMLERYAAETGLRSGLGGGTSAIDSRWNEIERFRFGSDPAPAELRDEILQFFRELPEHHDSRQRPG